MRTLAPALLFLLCAAFALAACAPVEAPPEAAPTGTPAHTETPTGPTPTLVRTSAVPTSTPASTPQGSPAQPGMTEEERFARAILGCWEAKDDGFEASLMGLFPEAEGLDDARAKFIEVNSSKTMEELDPVVDRHCPPGGHRTPTPAPAGGETQQEAATRQESGQTGQSGPAPTATPAPEPTPGPEDSDAYLPEAEYYAERYGVDLREATHRLRAQESIGKFGAALERNETEIFGGLWIQHEPDFRVIAAFTDGEAGVEAAARHFLEELQAVLIEVRVVEATYQELVAARREAMRLLEELGIASAFGINVYENRAEVIPTDRELLEKALEESGRTLPDHVVVVGGHVYTETEEAVPNAEATATPAPEPGSSGPDPESEYFDRVLSYGDSILFVGLDLYNGSASAHITVERGVDRGQAAGILEHAMYLLIDLFDEVTAVSVRVADTDGQVIIEHAGEAGEERAMPVLVGGGS